MPTRLPEPTVDVGCEVGYYGSVKKSGRNTTVVAVHGAPLSPLKLSTTGLVLVVGAASVLVSQVLQSFRVVWFASASWPG